MKYYVLQNIRIHTDQYGRHFKHAQVIDIIDCNAICIPVDMDKHIGQLSFMSNVIHDNDGYCSIHMAGLGWIKDSEKHEWVLRDTETVED